MLLMMTQRMVVQKRGVGCERGGKPKGGGNIWEYIYGMYVYI